MKHLQKIQQELKAPKSLYNSFGKYSYRSAETILEAVKPMLGECTLTLTDEIVEVGGRVYVKAMAIFKDGEDVTVTTAFAREPETKKGMDESQITGAASSYARKYALNGMFLIDDNKETDHADDSRPVLEPQSEQWNKAIEYVRAGGSIAKIEEKYQIKDMGTFTSETL